MRDIQDNCGGGKTSLNNFVKKNCWITFPVLLYIVLFFLHNRIQQYYSETCRRNFIVAWDSALFGDHVYFLMNRIQHWTFDLLSALPYLLHFSLPFLYSIYLLFLKKENLNFFKFILSFGIVCSVSVLLQYTIPTPPPWMLSTRPVPPEANFSRVDNILNVKLFKNIYSNSPLTCGAFPSLHTAWPTIIRFNRPWISKKFCWFHVGLIAFSAVYSLHHFVIDVIFGFLFGWVGCKIGSKIIDRVLSKEIGLENQYLGLVQYSVNAVAKEPKQAVHQKKDSLFHFNSIHKLNGFNFDALKNVV